MEGLLLALAVLACPVGMGVMMWMMMGHRRPAASDDDKQEQVAQLRTEVEALKAERAAPGEGR